MDDMISRAAAIKKFAEKREVWYGNGPLPSNESLMWQAAISITENLPAVDAVPVVHGRWINIPDKPEWDQKACSVCGDYFCCQNNYCPNCGAKMDGERRESE